MLGAVKSYQQSIGFLRRHGLLWFLWFPFLITILVFYGGFSLTSWATKHISDTIDVWLMGIDWFPDWAQVIQDILYWLLWILMRIILYFAFVFIGGSVILLLMAPILTWLSEKVAVALGKDAPPFTIERFIDDLLRAGGLAIRNGLLQLALAFLCFLIGFIPVVGAASPILLIVINAYFYGYNFLDYSLERKQLTIRESNRFVWRHKMKTLSVGLPYALWMLIPFFGPMSAGFMAILATVAGTMEIERMEDEHARIAS